MTTDSAIATKICGACKQKIGFIKTKKSHMPVDLPARVITEPKLGELIVLENGTCTRNPRVGMIGYNPHWQSCTNAGKFRNAPKIITMLAVVAFISACSGKVKQAAHFIASDIHGHACRQLVYADGSLGSKFIELPKAEVSEDGHSIKWSAAFLPGHSSVSFSTGKVTPITDEVKRKWGYTEDEILEARKNNEEETK